jgi:hypothetical protein
MAQENQESQTIVFLKFETRRPSDKEPEDHKEYITKVNFSSVNDTQLLNRKDM